MSKHFFIRLLFFTGSLVTFSSLQGQAFLQVSLQTPGNAGVLSERCGGPYALVFTRGEDNPDTTFIFISDLGVALSNQDYNFPAGSFPVRMLPQDSVVIIPIDVIQDGFAEGIESLIWEIAFQTTTAADILNFSSAIVDDYEVQILSATDTIAWCRNNPLPLEASANGNIHWSPAAYFQDSLGALAVVSPYASGWYYASVGTDTCGAKDSIYLDLAIAEILAADTVFICLDANGITLPGHLDGLATEFKWIPSDSTLSDTAILNPVANPKVTTTYVLQSDFGVCVASDTIVVRVDSIPGDLHIDIAPRKAYYCSGEIVALFSPTFDSLLYPDLGFEWMPDDGTFLTSKFQLNAALELRDTTLYIREAKNNACVSHDSILINVVPSGVPISVTDTVLCPGQMFTVSILSNQVSDPEWTPEDGLSCTKCLNPKVTVPGPPGNIIVYNFSGMVLECPVGASLVVQVPPVQQLNILGDTKVCEGDVVPLSIGNPENLTNLQWSIVAGNATLSCTDCLNPSVTVLGDQPINILLNASSTNLNFCGAAGFIQLVHGEEPVVTGPPISACDGGTTVATTGFPNFTNVQWSVAGGNLSLSCTSCPNPTVTVNSDGQLQFTAEVINPDTCGITGTVQVSIENIQVVGPPIAACLGETATATTGNPNFTNVQWDVVSGNLSLSCTDCSTPTVTVNDSGILRFFATTTQPDTCRLTGSVVVTALVNPDPVFFLTTPDTATTDIPQGSEVMVMFNVSGPQPSSLTWTVNGVTIPATSATIAFNANEEVNVVTVTFINSKGCTQTNSITIPTIPPYYEIPNAFTPNGDSFNDRFRIILHGNISIEEFLVFNRWGQLVYDAPKDDLEGWDGKFKGEKASSDTYVYKALLQYPNGRVATAKGDVMLIR